MAKHVLDKDQSNSWYINESNDTWVLTKGTTLVSQSTAIIEDQTQHDNKIVINGTVDVNDFMGTSYAIQIYGENSDIIVGDSGILTADRVVALTGNQQTLTNHGMIDGDETGVYMYNEHGTIDNFGTIEAYTGINAFGQASKIVNHAGGEIKGSGNAVYGFGDRDITIVNDGRLEGGLAAINIGDGDDRVVNHGKIVGDVNLGAGNDVFDTRGGKLAGTVEGGGGNDIYFVNNAQTDIQEDFLQGGIDTIKSTVSYEIATFIENVTLLGKKDIDVTGNALGNILKGNAGDNIIRGLEGSDTLSGGKGNDRLFGGDDADAFVFKTGDGHDVIADFDIDAGDHIDLSGMDAIKNYSNLVNHHLEVSGDDLLITAGDDQIRIKNFGEADIKAGMFDFG